MRMIRILILTGIVFSLLSSVAFAHSATIWAEVKDGKVYVEAYFGGGSKAKNARIVVLDAQENKLLEGKTDENGMFVFTPPVKDDLIILLLAGEGHQSKFDLKKSAFEQAEKTPEK